MRLIDADELLDKIVNVPSKVTEKTFYDKQTDLLTGSAFRQNEIIDIVNAMPTVEQKHGHWERVGYIDQCCSRCKETPECETGETPPLYDYCPHCGAKMDEVTEE